ncbi:MAG: 2-oxoglutarate dehydrogenase E1 component [Phycisphaerales bacterium JB039]
MAPRPVRPSINAWNAGYLDDQYEQYRRDPRSVDPGLADFFRGFELGRSAPGTGAGCAGCDEATLQYRADALITAYRETGHLAARLDPFGREPDRPRWLDPSYYDLTPSDLEAVIHVEELGLPEGATLREVIDKLERTYCGSLGVEFSHILDAEERRWIQSFVESMEGRPRLGRGDRAHILRQLLQAESFEKFLGNRYPGEKRFSLEGAESLIPLLNAAIERAAETGAEEIVLGMAHRGRLSVLNNVMGKTYEQIFTEFEDSWEEDFADGGGDVKYHRGYSAERIFRHGQRIHLAMASNPSHLEAVGPVVQGRTRAKQRLRGDGERRRVVPMLIHGDAAIAGQGLVAETLNLSQLSGYTTGGTVHVVVNNLIGFTTSPEDGRSTRYCTDVAKMAEAPVLHVNGEDPEACVFAAWLAVEYRRRFRKDVFIDMLCYRRYGHNEQDEASFTQPQLYKLIKGKPDVLQVYAQRLLADGVISEDDVDEISARLDEALEKAQRAARSSPYDPTIDPGSAKWSGYGEDFTFDPVDTGASMELIKEVCAALGRVPDGFHLNRKLKKLLKERAELPTTGDISYADGESLAIGALLLEGNAVRVSGQDSRRGTFSHRHAVLRDTETGASYIPLNHMRQILVPPTPLRPLEQPADGHKVQAMLCIYDSPLSEQAVLGFEYGYSLADPEMLVCWEAQFGDFINGAQVIIDQFITSAQAKWDRWSGLTLLLPHGYEGAGPEHSSARMERFLQLCGGSNIQVVYPTTGAQIFHLLRRQMRRPFRKPLVVMTPKSLLRKPTSRIDELTRGGFREIIDDPAFEAGAADPSAVRRLVLCTGKLYFELAERRDLLGAADVAIIRVEQLYPLHIDLLRSVLDRYPNVERRMWAQEEPRNAGAYFFLADRIRQRLSIELEYVGREASGTPATGSKSRHKAEQESIIERAVGPAPAPEDAGAPNGAVAQEPKTKAMASS